MTKVYNIETINQFHDLMGMNKPKYPLISVVSNRIFRGLDFGDARFSTNFYIISLKENLKISCNYGRNSYDFNDGTLIFLAPGQVMSSNNQIEEGLEGWSIFFHADLIRKFELSTTIDSYDFFDYEANEALHISENEKLIVNKFVGNIKSEIDQDLDDFGLELIVANLDMVLKYSLRFYYRQFSARHVQNKDILINFEKFLKSYFLTDQQLAFGIPTVDDCGKAMSMSGKYLSELLRVETGNSLVDHIHRFIIVQAKNLLLNSQLSVSELAYSLGFEYPQHFSSLFRKKTGLSPSKYRGQGLMNDRKTSRSNR